MCPHSWYNFRLLESTSISVGVNVLGPELHALAKFSSTCPMLFMPLNASDTSGWFHTHCSAQSGGERLTPVFCHSACICAGGFTAKSPPASGSITTTAKPFDAAYCRPAFACLVVLVKVVVLNLAKRPVIVGVDYFFENIQLVMEAKTQIADSALGDLPLSPRQHIQLLDCAPSNPALTHAAGKSR